MYPLLFLSTSHFSPHLNGIPIINRVPPVALTTSVPRPATGLPGYQSSVVSITIPSLDPSPKVQPEQVIWCSSFAYLVHKTCEQGQASGLKKSPPFGDSPAAHLSQKVVFFRHPCTHRSHTSLFRSCTLAALRLVLIVAWLLVLLHIVRSILTRGYSCPL